MKWFLIIACILLYFLLFVFFLSGCRGELSFIKLGQDLKTIDPNSSASIEAHGNAADILARPLAENLKTAAGRIAETQKYNPQLYAACVIVFVIGLLWWGFTQSRYGWVIPSAGIGGIALLFFTSSKLASWIPVIFIGLLVALLAWKAVEYQRERNEQKERQN